MSQKKHEKKHEKKPIPKHAYSFSAAGLVLISTTLNHVFSGNPALTVVGSLVTAGLIVHGVDDLRRERRLNRVLAPIFRFFQSQNENGTEQAHDLRAGFVNK